MAPKSESLSKAPAIDDEVLFYGQTTNHVHGIIDKGVKELGESGQTFKPSTETIDIGVKNVPFEERSRLAKVLIKHIEKSRAVDAQKHDDLKRDDTTLLPS
jgi:hypothetical protein